MFFSVVIPTYNRKPILEKCLQALEQQQFDAGEIAGYEVVVVDDGSTDGTVDWLQTNASEFPHVRLFQQDHQGPAAARNLGVEKASGDTIIFIDSDLVVTEGFLQAHADGLQSGQRSAVSSQQPLETQNSAPPTPHPISSPVFTYGRVINTANFDDPTAEPYKITDFSAAYFATGNVAIARIWLEKAGLFDTRFQLYGWEDLELGVRLKQLGLTLIKCPDAVGYHWHPPFALSQLPNLIDKEIERGKMGVLFYQKHPTWNVRMMIQMTWIHRVLWGVLSIGGRLNERTMAPFLQWLIDRGKPQLSLEVARIFLNWYNVQGVYEAYAEMQSER
ncbi:glycosyltransferase family 2 protein [Stenomitos frigidus]|uniref:Family 2 glycosyl transferase n=1 Tax=Stenomitos frigidus ULC18 TaxID=2107698 RepID=A0A2T1DVX4_9CYAN|nr:glycosyltransferase family 2 protein [Stenomitos frigidus]PSB24648.1 family 2 glycosyl transferase [Stenomitos frigidus ULC18]